MATFTRELPAPRVLRVALGAGPGGATAELAAPACAPGATLRLGGAALAVFLVARAAAEERAEACDLVLSVGSAVRRGLPTAARTTVAGRSPLTGGYSEGQVGGALAAALAGHADALVLAGRAPEGANLLRLGADGVARLESRPELAGLAPARVGALLAATERDTEATGLLCIGPAGEAGVCFAGLASGWSEPSFTGRGGLGALFGVLGLKALVVEPRAAESEPERDAEPLESAAPLELTALLASSPRLAQRAASGTLELFHAFAARGDLLARNHREPLEARVGAQLEEEARGLARGRHGCRGCPTPCGWVFERPGGGERGRAHFGAAYALGPNLGLEHFEDLLALHERCDAAGLDAREAGAVLALAARARELGRLDGPRLFGERDALLALFEEVAATGERGARAPDSGRAESGEAGVAHGPPWSPESLGALLAQGAERTALALGLEGELVAARGQAARPERRPAAVLGQCVATAGSDPVRAFPFLTEAGPRVRELPGLADLPPGAEDPESPIGKGRLVWWHENLAAALDSTGFCAFSAGGLLADGLADLDHLAAQLLGTTEREGAGELLLAHGAAVVRARRALDARWGRAGDTPPTWAADRLRDPELLPAYLAARDTGAGALPDLTCAPDRGLARLPRAVLAERLDDVSALALAGGRAPESSSAPCAGSVALRSAGVLAQRLGVAAELELQLPAPVADVLAAAARAFPSAAGMLLRGALPLPLVYRRGERLAPEALVQAGDELDLVLTVAGG